MKLTTTLSFVFIFFALVMTACGGGGGATEEGGGGSTAGGEVPAQYQGPIASSADATRGAELYDQACLSCHGEGAPALDNIGWTPARVRMQIREGGEGMPPLSTSRLSDEDMESILAHMATIGAVTP
jgi:mono/diheme cytochrome c family protein